MKWREIILTRGNTHAKGLGGEQAGLFQRQEAATQAECSEGGGSSGNEVREVGEAEEDRLWKSW